jgi:hypothetical protein
MGVITIHFHNDFLDLYESEIVRVTDRTITNVNKEMSETDSFGIYYQTKHNGVAYQLIPVMGIVSWDYYPSTSCKKAESHYKDDDPTFENLRMKLAAIAYNNEILRAVKNLD